MTTLLDTIATNYITSRLAMEYMLYICEFTYFIIQMVKQNVVGRGKKQNLF